jgi:hypothetical protein
VAGNEIELFFLSYGLDVHLFSNVELIAKKNDDRHYDNSRILQYRSKKF